MFEQEVRILPTHLSRHVILFTNYDSNSLVYVSRLNSQSMHSHLTHNPIIITFFFLKFAVRNRFLMLLSYFSHLKFTSNWDWFQIISSRQHFALIHALIKLHVPSIGNLMFYFCCSYSRCPKANLPVSSISFDPSHISPMENKEN